MCNRKDWARDWEMLREGTPLMDAIRDVLDNLGACGEGPEYEQWAKDNLLALVNIARQQTATDLYRRQKAEASQEISHHTPSTIKQTLREQRAAARALGLTSGDNTSSRGTSTATEDNEPF